MTLRSVLFTLLFLCGASLSGQLEWAIPPVIETPNFYLNLDWCDRFVIVGESGEGQRVMRQDGSFAFGGKRFKYVSIVGANCLHSGKDMDGQSIVFTPDEWMITDDYDAADAFSQTNLVLVKKGSLFGMVYMDGTIAIPLRYESIYQLKYGRYRARLPSGEETILEVPEVRKYDAANLAAIQKLYAGVLTDREVFREETAPHSRTWFWGIKDLDGKVLLAADHYIGHRGMTVQGHRFIICRDGIGGKFGALDSMGQTIIPFVYDEINRGSFGGKFLVGHHSDTAFIFTKEGNVHASMATERLSPLGRTGLLEAKVGTGFQLFDQELRLVLQDTFTDIYKGSADKIFLKKGYRRGFYSVKTGLYTEPRFKKVGGPYARAALPVAEDSKIGFFDVHTGEMLPPFIYDKVTGSGSRYLAQENRRDTVYKGGRPQIRFKREYHLLDNRGALLFGPTSYAISHVVGDVYAEQWAADTVMLYDFKEETTLMVTGDKVKVGPQITRRAADDFVFTVELVREQEPRSFTSLTAVKDTKLFIYQENGKYGLMTIDKRITPPRFSTMKIPRPSWGVKVEIDGKWGVLRLPKEYHSKD